MSRSFFVVFFYCTTPITFNTFLKSNLTAMDGTHMFPESFFGGKSIIKDNLFRILKLDFLVTNILTNKLFEVFLDFQLMNLLCLNTVNETFKLVRVTLVRHNNLYKLTIKIRKVFELIHVLV